LSKEVLSFREHQSGMTADEILEWISEKELQANKITIHNENEHYKMQEIKVFLNSLRNKLQKYSALEHDCTYLELKRLWYI